MVTFLRFTEGEAFDILSVGITAEGVLENTLFTSHIKVAITQQTFEYSHILYSVCIFLSAALHIRIAGKT